MRRWFRSLFSDVNADSEGATVVEYAIMLALIFGACLVGFTLLSQKTGQSLQNSDQALTDSVQ